MTENCVAKRLKVSGIVQGVGFRPFIFNLASRFEISGTVANNSDGVIILAAGLLLAFAFFGTLIWLLFFWDIVPVDSFTIVTYIVLLVISGVLATGISWSHIRRRMSGQLDVDDVDEA